MEARFGNKTYSFVLSDKIIKSPINYYANMITEMGIKIKKKNAAPSLSICWQGIYIA